MNTQRSFLALFILTVCAIYGQAQLHGTLDFRYGLGLSENVIDKNMSVENYQPSNISVAVSGLYEFTPQIWAGVGLNTSINNSAVLQYNGITYSTTPIMQFAPYLTMRYRPIKQHLNAYLFTDLGYSIPFEKSVNFSKGWLWNAGIGYSYMFRKHFGLNFNIGYNLLQIVGTPIVVTDKNTGNESKIISNNLRHSVTFAIGLVF